jgi:hypothetical protein
MLLTYWQLVELALLLIGLTHISFDKNLFLPSWKRSTLFRLQALRRYDMNVRFQMQGGKNRFLPKEMTANRFFWDSHWLEIWTNH